MTAMWEFFSYYGMRALLILYLSQSLNFSDPQAYSLFGSYVALIFLTPIVGGWIADKWIGHSNAIIVGSILFIIGHITLSYPGQFNLYLGLAMLTAGVGFFKTNAICLVASCYKKFPERHDSVFVWYYIVGNLGAAIGPIVCAIVVNYYGWSWGFATGGIGMSLGLALFLSQRHNVQQFVDQKFNLTANHIITLALGTSVAVLALSVILFEGLALWLLIGVGIAALPTSTHIYKKASKKEKKQLILLLTITCFSFIFWCFNQQGGSSISLYVLREVDRHIWSFTAPAAWFQAINPMIITIAGPLIAMLWRYLAKNNIEIHVIFKIMTGLTLLTLGFTMIIAGDKLFPVAAGGLSMMIWPVLGLCLIGSGELFIDPVVFSEINQKAPNQSKGFLTGLYYLFVGGYANYAAAQIAKLSVLLQPIHAVSHAAGYMNEFGLIVVASTIALFLLLAFSLKYSIKNT